MNSKKITDSPLSRAMKKGQIGADTPEGQAKESEKVIEGHTTKESKSQNTTESKKSDTNKMQKLSVYMPPSRHHRLKLYAVTHHEDMNSVINRLVENLLNEED